MSSFSVPIHKRKSEKVMSRAFQEMPLFAKHLPAIRRLIVSLMKSSSAKQRYHGTLMMLVDKCAFRRGYVSNSTDGVLTLRPEHFDYGPDGKCVTIEFTGKHQQQNHCTLCNNKLLLQNLKEAQQSGLMGRTGSVKLNRYLHRIHPLLKLKQFRTWIATKYYLHFVNKLMPLLKRRYRMNRVKLSIDATRMASRKLFNRRDNTYKYYVHPKVVSMWIRTGKPFDIPPRPAPGLTRTETALKLYLEKPLPELQLKREEDVEDL